MGFSLWISGDVAWAQGTYESRPMGAAVISVTDLFKSRDFHPARRPPNLAAGYVGLFASLGDLNAALCARRLMGDSKAGGDSESRLRGAPLNGSPRSR